MVDEFQDTDYAQSRLIDALIAGHRNIFVVADDDQSIYKFRGASRANLDRFEAAHPDRVKLILSRNYRSTPQIVEASRLIIGGADPGSRIEKGLTAQRGDGDAVEVWCADTERSEMHAIARDCGRLIEAGTPPSDLAVLFRRHIDMQAAIHALRECEVPFQVQGGRGFFRQSEIKDALALLIAIADPENSQSVLRCLLLPAWQVSAPGRSLLVHACAEHDLPLLRVVETGAVDGLTGSDLEAARGCVSALRDLNVAAVREDVREIFQAALEVSDFLSLLDLQTPMERMQCGANLNKFGELLETFAEWSDDRRTSTALRYLVALRNSGDADDLATTDRVEEGVALLTAHSAKGLEWPVVFLADCFEGRWPGRGGGWASRPRPATPSPTRSAGCSTSRPPERRTGSSSPTPGATPRRSRARTSSAPGSSPGLPAQTSRRRWSRSRPHRTSPCARSAGPVNRRPGGWR
jgi:DNA helicase-2/ATP-dependent DNA helicase PcrA